MVPIQDVVPPREDVPHMLMDGIDLGQFWKVKNGIDCEQQEILP
jgi:hypothetical protein